MARRRWYIAGNRYEGCGHRHKSIRTARRCLPRIDAGHGPRRVYRVRPLPKVVI